LWLSRFHGRPITSASNSTVSIAIINHGGMATFEPKQPQLASPAVIWVTSTPSKTTNIAIRGSQLQRGRSSASSAMQSSMAIARL